MQLELKAEKGNIAINKPSRNTLLPDTQVSESLNFNIYLLPSCYVDLEKHVMPHVELISLHYKMASMSQKQHLFFITKALSSFQDPIMMLMVQCTHSSNILGAEGNWGSIP